VRGSGMLAVLSFSFHPFHVQRFSARVSFCSVVAFPRPAKKLRCVCAVSGFPFVVVFVLFFFVDFFCVGFFMGPLVFFPNSPSFFFFKGVFFLS